MSFNNKSCQKQGKHNGSSQNRNRSNPGGLLQGVLSFDNSNQTKPRNGQDTGSFSDIGCTSGAGYQNTHSSGLGSSLPEDFDDHHYPQGVHGINLMGTVQVQAQEQLHRSVQASTQMLYDVFDYTIGMIEELEKHEQLKEKPANSGILKHLIPLEHKKPVDEVYTGIEVELQCLSIQMRYLSPEIIKNSKEAIVHQLLQWAACRGDMPLTAVDDYCRNVLEVLLFGNHRNLPERARPEVKVKEEVVNKAMFQVARGRHIGAKQDEGFHNDPKKKAKLHKKRDGGKDSMLKAGARRLVPEPDKNEEDQELWQALEKYLRKEVESMDTDSEYDKGLI